MRVRGRTVWVVGASAGIGEYVAYECAKRGATRVILSARRLDSLKRVADRCQEFGAIADIEPLDVTRPDDISSVCDRIASTNPPDIVVLNAGVSQRALASETDISIDRRIMEINYFGNVDIAKRMLPHMLESGAGQFAVTSSVVGKFGFPLRSAYASSKHALHGFFETLHIENKSKGVTATVVCPGRIRTDISKNAVTADGSSHGVMDPGQAKGMDVEVCARRYVSGIERNRREVYIGFETILIYLRKFAPPLFFRIAGKVDPK